CTDFGIRWLFCRSFSLWHILHSPCSIYLLNYLTKVHDNPIGNADRRNAQQSFDEWKLAKRPVCPQFFPARAVTGVSLTKSRPPLPFDAQFPLHSALGSRSFRSQLRRQVHRWQPYCLAPTPCGRPCAARSLE